MSVDTSPRYTADVPESITTPDLVRSDRLGDLAFMDGVPLDETVEKVYEYLDFSRAVDSFLTGIPAASVRAFGVGLRDAGVEPYQMGIAEQLLDARSLWLTPNTTTMYCATEIDVKDGPVVMEVPPATIGMVDDAYFRWVTDLGFTGPDRGQGGTYVFAHRDDVASIPDGVHEVRTPTYRHFTVMRAFVVDGDLERTVAAIKAAWRVYPLARMDNPPQPVFVNISGKRYSTVHANTFEFYEELNDVVQYEPSGAFNVEHAGLWASIGIRKGHPFEPGDRMKRILTEGAAVGNAIARSLSFAPRSREPFIYEDRNWYNAFVGGKYDFIDDGAMMLDYRVLMHYMATGITPAMAHSQVGQGSAYAFAARDANGQPLDGSRTYSVTLPSPVPAKDFWSFVVYSGQHRSLLETDQALAGIDSTNPHMVANDDDTFTIWFAPEPPTGREGNWVQTVPGKSWSTLFRLYGPLEPWFDRTWKPTDVQPAD